jgi:hypothetical protein
MQGDKSLAHPMQRLQVQLIRVFVATNIIVGR